MIIVDLRPCWPTNFEKILLTRLIKLQKKKRKRRTEEIMNITANLIENYKRITSKLITLKELT